MEKCYWCNSRVCLGAFNLNKVPFNIQRQSLIETNVLTRYACRTHRDHLKLWAGLEQFQKERNE